MKCGARKVRISSYRCSTAQALVTITPALVRHSRSAPDPAVLRRALITSSFNASTRTTPQTPEEVAALEWIAQASLPVSKLAEPEWTKKALKGATWPSQGGVVAAVAVRCKDRHMDMPSDEPLSGLSRVVRHRLIYDGQELMCAAFSLRFAEGVLLIEAEPNTDTIHLSIGAGPELRFDPDSVPVPEDVTKTEPWASLVGADVGWRWLLVNQQGYVDGFQVEFSRDHQKVVTCQWMVWGASVQYAMFPGTN